MHFNLYYEQKIRKFYLEEKAKEKTNPKNLKDAFNITEHDIVTPGTTPYVENGVRKYDEHDETTRDFLYALPTDNKVKYEEAYQEILDYIIGRYEKIYESVYDDGRVQSSTQSNLIKDLIKEGKIINGKRTVGIGFNMDDINEKTGENRSKILWNNAFKDFKNKPDFDRVRNADLDLNYEQIKKLFHYMIKDKEKDLEKYLGKEVWDKMHFNVQIAITDFAYNAGASYLKENHKKNNLNRDLRDYYLNDNEEGLKKVAEYFKNKAEEYRNSKTNRGLAKRRKMEYDLINS